MAIYATNVEVKAFQRETTLYQLIPQFTTDPERDDHIDLAALVAQGEIDACLARWGFVVPLDIDNLPDTTAGMLRFYVSVYTAYNLQTASAGITEATQAQRDKIDGILCGDRPPFFDGVESAQTSGPVVGVADEGLVRDVNPEVFTLSARAAQLEGISPEVLP